MTEYEGSGELNINSILRIQSIIKVSHYRNSRECCYHNYYEECQQYCDNCRYTYTDYRTDELVLEDSKTAFQNWPVIIPVKIVSSYEVLESCVRRVFELP